MCFLYYNNKAERRCNSMAECPLPKPNTRVRFPSSAPIQKPPFSGWLLYWNRSWGLQNLRTRRKPHLNHLQTLCALNESQACEAFVWVQIPVICSKDTGGTHRTVPCVPSFYSNQYPPNIENFLKKQPYHYR